MDNINYILSLIDWNNTLDQQAAGIKIAESIWDIQAFIQPCTESYNKNVWDNCALIYQNDRMPSFFLIWISCLHGCKI